MLLDVRLLAGAPHEQVAEEVALVLVLDRGHRALPGDQQGGHDRHPLEGVHVLLADRPVQPHADQPRQVGAAGGDAQGADLADAEGQPAVGDPLDADPARDVDQPGVGQPGPGLVAQRRRALAAVGGGQQHADPEDVGRLGGDLPEVTALEDQVGQRRVQRVHPGERMGRVVANGHARLLAVNT